ncbi:MAG: hypothetical protein LHV68_09490 [Elusimicrobia bacterium]|nr:hypothetical protein [Candidatus Liberimonas magnetica]
MRYFKTKLFIYLAVFIFAYLFINPYYLFPDGQGYFSYLPSIFYDGDIDFYNDFTNMRIPIPLALTKTGYISNNWSFGTAFFWTPFYLTAKILAKVDVSPYSVWFWYWVNSGTIFYGILAFYLIVLTLKEMGYKSYRILVAITAFIGTPMFFYTFILSCTAHAITAFVITLFLWAWLYSMPDKASDEKNKFKLNELKRFTVLGLILGAAFMARPQEALFGVVVLFELGFRLKDGFIKALKSGAVFIFSFLLGASPQLIIWKLFYGSFFYAPSKFNVSLKYFALPQVLFSSYHGILTWTPVFFIAFFGLCFGLLKNAKIFSGLIAAFLGQLLINSCCVAYWEGYSFGLRQMVSTLPLAAIGISEFWSFFELKPKFIKAIGLALIVIPGLWTAGLLLNYYSGLDLLWYLSYKDILTKQAGIIFNLKGIFNKLAALSRPELSLFIGILVVGSIFYIVFEKLKNQFEKARLYPVILFLAIILAGYDIIILKAHLNKPMHTGEQTASLITSGQLDEFFIGQVQEIKKKYNLK